MKKMLFFFTLLIILAANSLSAAIGGGDIALKNKGGDVVFSHATHVEVAGLKCRECHPKPFINSKQHKAVTMKAMQKGASCGSCHNGSKAFPVKDKDACAKCHAK